MKTIEGLLTELELPERSKLKVKSFEKNGDKVKAIFEEDGKESVVVYSGSSRTTNIDLPTLKGRANDDFSRKDGRLLLVHTSAHLEQAGVFTDVEIKYEYQEKANLTFPKKIYSALTMKTPAIHQENRGVFEITFVDLVIE